MTIFLAEVRRAQSSRSIFLSLFDFLWLPSIRYRYPGVSISARSLNFNNPNNLGAFISEHLNWPLLRHYCSLSALSAAADIINSGAPSVVLCSLLLPLPVSTFRRSKVKEDDVCTWNRCILDPPSFLDIFSCVHSTLTFDLPSLSFLSFSPRECWKCEETSTRKKSNDLYPDLEHVVSRRDGPGRRELWTGADQGMGGSGAGLQGTRGESIIADFAGSARLGSVASLVGGERSERFFGDFTTLAWQLINLIYIYTRAHKLFSIHFFTFHIYFIILHFTFLANFFVLLTLWLMMIMLQYFNKDYIEDYSDSDQL